MAQPKGLLQSMRRAPILMLALVLAVLLTWFFALRLTGSARIWTASPADPPIASWMTPRYVAHAWQVPPEVIADALALEQDGTGRRVTLEALAEARGTEPDDLAATLTAAIARHRREAQ